MNFLRVSRRYLIFFALFMISISVFAQSRPVGHIFDKSSALPLQISKGLERVLDQHEKLTGETVFLVVSREENVKVEVAATELFESWKLDTVDPTKAVLIHFHLGTREVAVRAGIGMETFLSAFPLERTAEKVYRAELSHGSLDRGLVLSVLEVLKVLSEPSLPEAQAILIEAGFSEPFTPRAPRRVFPLWPFVLGVGTLLFIYVLMIALSGEAHYSSEGWTRIRRWFPRLRKSGAPRLITGGGVSGSY